MSAEERWAQQKEWAEEKYRGFDIEIKGTSSGGDSCFVQHCDEKAVITYEIGPVREKWSRGVELCEDHDHEDTALEVYQEMDGQK